MPAVRTELTNLFGTLTRDTSLAHSYLIISRDGVSLAATARAMQQAIDGPQRFNLADGMVVEPDGTSIGIDSVRSIREHLGAYPGIAPYRTALVLHGELMTTEAQNALLKIAEEPASQSVLLVAVTDEERILPTLRSRLQRVPLQPLSEDLVTAWLLREHDLSADEAASIAARSAGSLSLSRELVEGSGARNYAEQLLGASPAQVAGIAKSAAAEEVTLQELLRALSVALAYTAHTARTRELWHRIQRLSASAQLSPLNLRLQIAALFSDLPQ